MGARGPAPKRSDQRRRRNAPAAATRTAPAARSRSKRPPVDRTWHPVVKRWYLSLAESGQARFYEPSDWATAVLLAESMSRELAPTPLIDGHGRPVMDAKGKPMMTSRPPRAAALAAWSSVMSKLLVTEGDRRRLQIELQLPDADGDEEAGSVSSLDAWRSRTDGTG